ncbi:MAG: hypothetical protein C0467_25725 [Planctomycetaceae bacterium]|nr:hypothetical protein [Planctomycetaceae bacterium]
MRVLHLTAFTAILGIASFAITQTKQPPLQGEYVNKGSRAETIRATLASHGLPNLEGKWYYAGPFDNNGGEAFETAYPPEKSVDLKATYAGKGGKKIGWEEFKGFTPGKVTNLMKFSDAKTNAAIYLYHTFESPVAYKQQLSFGSDDTLSVFFNGKRVIHENHTRAAAADQDLVEVDVKQGANELLIKVCQGAGEWELYASTADLPKVLPETIRRRLERDFPPKNVVAGINQNAAGEAKFYKINTIPLPPDCVLEVGGMGFRPDGKLLACTRRGEVWMVENPTSDSLGDVKVTKYAGGLHEALGLWVKDNDTVYVVQRPELTKIVEKDGVASEFTTVNDKWGVSGDYHEFAFGPARDKAGNFFITLNVGFGGGHQAKAPWRGWCVKVTPEGKMEPYAYGLRSPNGVNFSPEGELFYCDNQGEWVATNKMHHLKQGKFYGHQAGLRWVKDSPFAGKVPDKVPSGIRYDGVDKNGNQTDVYPDFDPPCIWFPYGRMGKSASEPVWDTTGGKFGPFTGQAFVGDQTNSSVMRVALEKVNGVYQGACFPFRSGLQCGVNRLCFAPDGSLMVGQTNRGWGSLGGKPYGLQRIAYDGKEPFDIHHVTLTKDGFDLVFTKPISPESIGAKPASVSSFTYIYKSDYGCPETDTRFEMVGKVKLSDDGKTLSVPVGGLRKGRVFEIRLDGITTADGEKVLHPEAYYTLNELVK